MEPKRKNRRLKPYRVIRHDFVRRRSRSWGRRFAFVVLFVYSCVVSAVIVLKFFPPLNLKSEYRHNASSHLEKVTSLRIDEGLPKVKEKDLNVAKQHEEMHLLSNKDDLTRMELQFNESLRREIEDNVKNAKFRDLYEAEKGQKKLLLATTWRSGSTFIGSLFNLIPGSFYTFEPLLESALKENSTNSTRIMQQVLNCNFSSHEIPSEVKKRTNLLFHLLFMSLLQFKWLVEKHNSRVSDICRGRSFLKGRHRQQQGAISMKCLDSRLLSQTCRASPVHVVKTVRLRIDRHLLTLMSSDPNLKLVALFRDPR